MISLLRGLAKRATGDDFEARALAFLQSHDLVLVTRNWRSATGEIDLVMREGETLVFVEVRKRSSTLYGGALQSITNAKATRIARTASSYLSRLPSPPHSRIDAVSFDANNEPVWTKNILA
jgi:putative endonuclease